MLKMKSPLSIPDRSCDGILQTALVLMILGEFGSDRWSKFVDPFDTSRHLIS